MEDIETFLEVGATDQPVRVNYGIILKIIELGLMLRRFGNGRRTEANVNLYLQILLAK